MLPEDGVPSLPSTNSLLVPPAPLLKEENWPLLTISKGFFETLAAKGAAAAAAGGGGAAAAAAAAAASGGMELDENELEGAGWGDELDLGGGEGGAAGEEGGLEGEGGGLCLGVLCLLRVRFARKRWFWFSLA
jgi:coatomer protein complex subunit alpha (xenin)